jgi:hypothetical protein
MSRIHSVQTIKRAPVLVPANGGTLTSGAVDLSLLNAEGPVAFCFAGKTTAGTSPTIAAKLQTSSDDGDQDSYADLTGAVFTLDADGFGVVIVDPASVEQFVKVVSTIGGTDTPKAATVAWIEYTPRDLPADAQSFI